jgi:hypothetical protein
MYILSDDAGIWMVNLMLRIIWDLIFGIKIE